MLRHWNHEILNENSTSAATSRNVYLEHFRTPVQVKALLEAIQEKLQASAIYVSEITLTVEGIGTKKQEKNRKIHVSISRLAII